MAQERMDDWMQYAKACAKADKELGIEHWVYISFERRLADGTREKLHHYDIPREMLERWLWLIEWRRANLICKYPRSHINSYYSYYDKCTGLATGFGTFLDKLSSAKGQITKMERVISEYIEDQKRNNLFFNPETDEILLKAYNKLAQKKENFNVLFAYIEQEAEKYKKKNSHV